MFKRGIQSSLTSSKALMLNKQPILMAQRAFASGTHLEKFNFEDPLCLEDLLTEEEKMVRDAARAYAQEKLMPRIRKAYNEEKFDIDIMREMGAQGFLGCTSD